MTSPTPKEPHAKPRCVFCEAWVGQCKAAADGDPPICAKHRSEKCWCGEQATGQCGVAGSFVCGAPLCADHHCINTGYGMTGTGPHSEQGLRENKEWKKWQAKIRSAVLAERARCAGIARSYRRLIETHETLSETIAAEIERGQP